MPAFRRSTYLLIFALCPLCLFSSPATAGPSEIKDQDELIVDYGHSAYEIETNLFQAPASQCLSNKI